MIVEALGEPQAGPDQMRPDQLAARLADRGVDVWTVAAGREIELAMRRVRRGS